MEGVIGMDDSILNNLKKMLGMDTEFNAFDQDLIIHINSVFMTLHQLGVGPKSVFRISGSTETWSNFLADSRSENDLSAVKDYIYLKLRILFDPPSTSYVLSALESQMKELEWRLNVQAERGEEVDI